MKNTTMTKVTALVLLLTMIAITIISGTYAKYATEATGESSVIAAKWDIKFGANGTDTTTKTIDLFSSINDLAGVANVNDLSKETATAETDVATSRTDETKKIVAPGTWGKVALQVTNKSEVKAAYTLKIEDVTVTEGLPIEFSLNGTTWSDATTIKNEKTTGVLEIGNATEQKADSSIYWRWKFDGDDNTDTTIGKTGKATCKVKVSMKAVQVD